MVLHDFFYVGIIWFYTPAGQGQHLVIVFAVYMFDEMKSLCAWVLISSCFIQVFGLMCMALFINIIHHKNNKRNETQRLSHTGRNAVVQFSFIHQWPGINFPLFTVIYASPSYFKSIACQSPKWWSLALLCFVFFIIGLPAPSECFGNCLCCVMASAFGCKR